MRKNALTVWKVVVTYADVPQLKAQVFKKLLSVSLLNRRPWW
jgi:hypothetical protein